MEIIPGVHQVDDVTGSNVVLIVGDEMTLIDTGVGGNGRGARQHTAFIRCREKTLLSLLQAKPSLYKDLL